MRSSPKWMPSQVFELFCELHETSRALHAHWQLAAWQGSIAHSLALIYVYGGWHGKFGRNPSFALFLVCSACTPNGLGAARRSLLQL